MPKQVLEVNDGLVSDQCDLPAKLVGKGVPPSRPGKRGSLGVLVDGAGPYCTPELAMVRQRDRSQRDTRN